MCLVCLVHTKGWIRKNKSHALCEGNYYNKEQSFCGKGNVYNRKIYGECEGSIYHRGKHGCQAGNIYRLNKNKK